MDVTVEQHEGICVVAAKGRIDTLTSKTFGERVTALIDAGAHRMVIDLAQIAYISSAGFRALLIAGKKIDGVQGRLVLAGVTGEVRRLFDIAALTELFTLCSSRQEGLQTAGAGTAPGATPGAA